VSDFEPRFTCQVCGRRVMPGPIGNRLKLMPDDKGWRLLYPAAMPSRRTMLAQNVGTSKFRDSRHVQGPPQIKRAGACKNVIG
jgi:hypothetical protein